MKLKDLEFGSSELDQFLAKWLQNGLSREEQQEWNKLLTFDTKLREEFADWIKSLRDAGWGSVSNRGSENV